MNKIDYLKRCVTALEPLQSKNWYIYMLGIPSPTSADYQQLEVLTPYPQPDGMYFVDVGEDGESRTLIKITDSKPNEPVFHIQDIIEVDSTWLPTISGKMQTKLGNLVINAVAVVPSVGHKVGYLDGALKVSSIEEMLAKRIVDDDQATDNDISVSNYIDFMDRLWFFTAIANLVNVATTPKLITRAPGTKELRKKLLEENKDKLSDPAVVASIVDQLNKHDQAYLAGDPVVAKGLSKKEVTARKKLHQMYGETNDFDATLGSDPITGSMDEGLATNDKDLPKYINDLRYASYSRGHSTQLSGYTYKILQRSLSGLEIVDQDCGTKIGLVRLITDRNQSKLLNRFVKTDPKDKDWTLVETPEQAKSYLGKRLITRSAMYCLSPGNTLCYRCLGDTFKGSSAAMTNLAASMSAEFMTLFLKRMHTSGFGLTTIEKKDMIT